MEPTFFFQDIQIINKDEASQDYLCSNDSAPSSGGTAVVRHELFRIHARQII
jgi:hypothetical protein